LLQIQKRVKSIRGVYEVPEALLFSIPVIRFLSSSLFNLIPHVSKRLCELSINLGSMTVDSATITGANFDLKVATRQSSNFLDEVKLMVDSKISKLYPNLESVKPDPT
ncbi:MAG: hypothetical protein GWN01_17110, partial [Nitrosopumilaceae archaeon]|nr:hypothetical protein [Nitrosopumilaceae archaeon]NIU89007.1 hypothetical protein [Nitrosopumilaceae archaeon]NIV67115.1 hypothetical protein [Nitrosopumilaceae archaeon]NIX63152.1 hypothetical protein [Nitrosopumilaceae archaeon]